MATYHVPDTGNPVTNMTNLQSRVDSVAPGDVITLAAGVLYSGTLTIPEYSNPSGLYFTITSDASAASLPPEDGRMHPRYAALLPTLQPTENNKPAIKTCNPSAGVASYWHFKFLHILGNNYGGSELFSLGSNDSSLTNKQDTLAKVPHHFKVDRCLIHGKKYYGQKAGLALHCRYAWVTGNYIYDCCAQTQDAQAIYGCNGPGDYVIDNNYLSGSTENVMMGGDAVRIPNLVPQTLTFTRNDCVKPKYWRNPILDSVTNLTATPGTGGSLSAGDHDYVVVAHIPQGYTNIYTRSSPVTVTATTGASGTVTLEWGAVDGATGYRVYRDNATYFNVTDPTFEDTGQSGTAGTAPTSAGNKWWVKNLFELKNFDGALVRGNRFIYNWPPLQSGSAILFTPNNQAGGNPSTVIQNVTFEYNIIAHCSCAFNVTAYNAPYDWISQRTNHITIRHNLILDLAGSEWGGTGSKTDDIVCGFGNYSNPKQGADYVTFENNTTIGGGKANFIEFTQTPTATDWHYDHLVVRNNVTYNGSGGVRHNAGPLNQITNTLNASAPGWVFERNAVASATAGSAPPNNFYLTQTAHEACFVNYAGGNYRIAAASSYANAGTDGDDLGVNITALMGLLSTEYEVPVVTDVSYGSWLPNNLASLSHALSECDDATYALSAVTPTNDTCEMKLENSLDIPSMPGIRLVVKCKTP